ncbi:MAG TPA: ankyrin repeat domain-containing protein [Candidatus Wallbacteria bacterium]|nr:ankyrin repeat domain-containing protein [Candidatus Wallbacteria bacterium]
MKIFKTVLSSALALALSLLPFAACPNYAAAETRTEAYGMNDEVACGDYIYKLINCALNKQEAKTDNFFISLSARNTGPESGPFPPIALVNTKSKKEIKPAEKLPPLDAGAALVLNLNFAVEKNAEYILKVSGDAEGYLNATVDLKAEVSDLKNELIKAAAEGDAKKIKELLKKGANANTVNEKKETVLMLAAGSGSCEAVRILLEKGANIKTSNLNDEHALYYAIESGDYDTVKLLLEKGANTYYTNYRGKTPLIAAKAKGDDKIYELVRKYSDKGF